jgi:hypothetical protein
MVKRASRGIDMACGMMYDAGSSGECMWAERRLGRGFAAQASGNKILYRLKRSSFETDRTLHWAERYQFYRDVRTL